MIIYILDIFLSQFWTSPLFHIIYMWLVTQSCPTLCESVDYSPSRYSVHGNSPGKNTGVGCHALLQGIVPTQGSNPGLHLYHLSHLGLFFPLKSKGSIVYFLPEFLINIVLLKIILLEALHSIMLNIIIIILIYILIFTIKSIFQYIKWCFLIWYWVLASHVVLELDRLTF